MTWNGSPATMLVNQSLDMPASPNGPMVLTATSQSANQGLIALTTGNGEPMFLPTPVVLSINADGTGVNVTNVSTIENTPILVALTGSPIPASTQKEIPIGLPGVSLASGQSAQANVPGPMQLVITSITAAVGAVTIIGGPDNADGNNAYVIAVNWPQGVAMPSGYYAVTSNRSYTMSINWGLNVPLSATVFSQGAPTAINVMLL